MAKRSHNPHHFWSTFAKHRRPALGPDSGAQHPDTSSAHSGGSGGSPEPATFTGRITPRPGRDVCVRPGRMLSPGGHQEKQVPRSAPPRSHLLPGDLWALGAPATCWLQHPVWVGSWGEGCDWPFDGAGKGGSSRRGIRATGRGVQHQGTPLQTAGLQRPGQGLGARLWLKPDQERKCRN